MAALGVATVCVLTEAFYVPRFGQAALDSAHNDYLECVRNLPIIDCAPFPCKFHVPSEGDCFIAYMDRRERILWRYFFFRTLAKRI
jgi:hypothetical protein